MDDKGEFIMQTATRAEKRFRMLNKTLQFLVLLSVCFFFASRFSGFSVVIVSYDSWFSALVFPLFANALDRKYMFLVCNGILVFLSKNMRCSSSCSRFDYSDGLAKCSEVGAKQISEPHHPKEAQVEESGTHGKYATLWRVVAVEEGMQKTQQQQEQYCDQSFTEKADAMRSEVMVLDSKDEEDEDDEAEESQALEDESEESVSTAELNKKFDEFIRKMKEEIRIEARQQLITV